MKENKIMEYKYKTPLDMRDMAIIDAFPTYDVREKTILNIGCGEGRIDFHLANMGYRVYATDIKRYETWINGSNPSFHISDIFDLSSIPVSYASIVVCSQVLKHLSGYKMAMVNLFALTDIRLIITVPYRYSFNSPDHCNYWDDSELGIFKDINEFVELCKPYSTSISKIRTKPKDKTRNKYDYLITVDKG